MNKILDKLMSFISHNDDIDQDQYDIARYGLELLLMKIIFNAASLVIAILIGSFWECVIFIMFFSVIRDCADGYHAESKLKCFILSMLTVAGAVGILKLMNGYPVIFPILSGLTVPAVVTIILLAPMDCVNDPKDDDEIRALKKRTHLVLAAELLLGTGSYFMGFKTIAGAVILSLIGTASLLIVGFFKNKTNNMSR